MPTTSPQWVIKRRTDPPEYWGVDVTVGFTPNYSKARHYDSEDGALITIGIYKSKDPKFNDAFPCVVLGGE